MDSIEVPDVDKIKKLSDKKFKGSGVNRTADEIFDGEKFNKAGEFDRATKTYDDPTRHKEEDDKEDDFLEDAAAMPAQAATGLSKGVKVGDSYVKRSKIIKTVVAVIIVLVLMVFFFPPLFFNDADKSVVRYDDNVFKTMGMTDFKTYALSNYSVYNEEAADYTGIGRNTLRQLVEWKKLPVLKVGRKVLIKTDILEMFMEANEGRDLRDRGNVKAVTRTAAN